MPKHSSGALRADRGPSEQYSDRYSSSNKSNDVSRDVWDCKTLLGFRNERFIMRYKIVRIVNVLKSFQPLRVN